MAKPIRFKAKFPKVRFVNRCIICGRIIPYGSYICSSCVRRKRPY